MLKNIIAIISIFILLICCACAPPPTSNDVQRDQQNKLLNEATAQTGMPNIKNFRERKLAKDILELRDQTGLITYTYVFSDYNACFLYMGETVGYPLPYATQYTAPETVQTYNLKAPGSDRHYGATRLPQADPNGLFSPATAEATWSLMKNPAGKETGPGYMEIRINAFPFKLPDRLVCPSKGR